MTMAGDPHGPAVLLASADSIFTALLAKHWLSTGHTVKVVTLGERGTWLPPEVEVIDVRQRRSFVTRALGYFGGPPAHLLQRACVCWGQQRFTQVTGKAAADDWEWNIFPPWLHAGLLAKTALSLRPRFVFGQEAMMYGRATALCGGVPRILFPWGSDVYNSPESWFGVDWLVRSGLRGVDLVVPSATCAGTHLIERFGVDPEKVCPISWGIELSSQKAADAVRQAETRKHWNIPKGIPVVFNSRRFRPQWGSDVVLPAFLEAAKNSPQSHYVILAGPGAEQTVAQAVRAIEQQGLSSRFTLIDRQIASDQYNDLAALAEVFVSLTFRGDMRSSSVLQCAGLGAAPVIGEACEYRHIATQGFAAEFVSSTNPHEVANAITSLLQNPARRRTMQIQNKAYIQQHEDRTARFEQLQTAIDAVCARYYGT